MKIDKDEFNHQKIELHKLASLGELAVSLAHEISSPLTFISGNVYFLKKLLKKDKFDSDLFHKYTDNIEQTVQRISKITKGLLAFSRSEDGDEFKTESIQSILEMSLVFCSEKLKNQNICLTHNLAENDLKIECQSTQISQIFLNLLNNAHDAIKKLEEKWIRIEIVDLDQFVEIKVTDSGKGISADIQNKIMQPFFTSKKMGEGTGLGLSVSTRIIQNHSGKLFLNSEALNTQFVIQLPKQQIQKN